MARSTILQRTEINNQIDTAGSYDNTSSALTATSVQGAIDEVETRVDTLEGVSHEAVTISPTLANGLQIGLALSGQELELALATTDDGGAMSSADKTKLDGIEALATADQTGAEIKALYEAEANTNAFTDADETKLDGIETGATADQNAAEVPVALAATNYTAATADVEAHLVGLHTEIGNLQTALVGGVTYVGGYNAATNTPDLEAPAGGAVAQGDMYTVTADGNFFTEAVTIGDVLIAEVADPSTLTDWTVVENNIEDAADVAFNNATSGLVATNVQTAIDEVEGRVDTLEGTSHAAVTLDAGDTTQETLDLTGQVITVNLATASTDGAFAATDKAKLDGIEAGATADQTAAEVTFSNGTSGLAATDVQTAIDEVEGRLDTVEANTPSQPATVNRETITINKGLVNGDAIYQHIITTTAALLVNLPGSPVNGTHYIIKNAANSTQSFTTNSIVINPGDLYEVIYDGTEWVVL